MDLIDYNTTYFKCKRCHKELHGLNTTSGICAECINLENRGIFNTEQYNAYLKKTITCENCKL